MIICKVCVGVCVTDSSEDKLVGESLVTVRGVVLGISLCRGLFVELIAESPRHADSEKTNSKVKDAYILYQQVSTQ